MGKVTTNPSTTRKVPKQKNKRRKRDLDKIHSKILEAKSKLDNIDKHGNTSRQKKPNQAKICSRLLPKSVPGIYRNGSKGKDVHKAETLENKINNARLKADALELFNGYASESKQDEPQITLFDEPIAQSSHKSRNSSDWTASKSEQSPILGKRQDHNQNARLGKKESEDTFFKNLDANRNRKDKVNESRDTVQKDIICKRKLFQNDEQSRVVDNNLLILDTIDLTQENVTSEEKSEKSCLANKSSFNNNTFWDPASRYKEFCNKMSAGISNGFTQIHRLDPIKNTLKALSATYAECFRQQLLRENKAANTESSTEYQACTYSDSNVEFEVPKCDDDDTIAANLSKNVTPRISRLSGTQNFMRQKDNDVTQYDSVSLENFAVSENDGSNDDQFVNRFADVSQPPKLVNLRDFANEIDSVDFWKNVDHVGRASEQNQHRRDDFRSDHKHSRRVDNPGCSKVALIFPSDSASLSTEKSSLPRLPTGLADTGASNDAFQKPADGTANDNIRNTKQIPKIIRRYNDNISVTRRTYSARVNDDDRVCTESVYKKFETLFKNGTLTNKSRATDYPSIFHASIPTPSILITPIDRSQLSRSRNGSTRVRNDPRESRINDVDINVRANGTNENGFTRFASRSQNTHEDSRDSNAHRTLIRPEQVAPVATRQVFRASNNRHSVNRSQTAANIPTCFNVEQTNRAISSQIARSGCVCEATGNARQQFVGNCARDQNSNVLLNGGKAAPIATTTCCSQGSQFDGRCGEHSGSSFGETDAERVQSQTTDRNVWRCDERCTAYHANNSADYYPPERNVSQTTRHFHEDTVAQPGISNDANVYYGGNAAVAAANTSADPSSGLRNVSFLPLSQKCGSAAPYAYLRTADGDQHRATVLLQNVAQPVKYLAVKNDSTGVQRIPVYVNNGSVDIAETVPLNVVALMDPSGRTRAYARDVTQNQAMPLRASGRSTIDELAIHPTNTQPTNSMLYSSELRPNIWYASNL